MKLVEIILNVETRFFFLVEILKIETFPVETTSCGDFCRDC
jgi:hypothetical protein